MEHKFSLTSRHEPEPYGRSTATYGDHDATAATATTAPGADENDDDPDDKHEYVNTETYNIIESKKIHSYDIDKQCSKQVLNATNVSTKSPPNTGIKKKQQQVLNETNVVTKSTQTLG